MTLIILVAGLTLAASFFCSLFEAALYAIPQARVEVLRERGARGAERLARMREDVEEPIAAILTINTIAHTVGSAWCGALVGELYGSRAVGVFAAIFTFLVLAVTEIVPKSIGVRYASTLGPMVVWPIQVLVWSVYPIVWLAKRAMQLLTRAGAPSGPSEAEVVVLAGLAAQAGGVRAEESLWVRNALRLDQRTAGDLRTPRTVTETRPADTPVVDAVRDPKTWIHSRVPLTESGNPDHITGIVHRREVFDAAISPQAADLILADLQRPIKFVPESMRGHELLNLFLREREHLVAVVDEYGGLEGVVSLEDVLEYMLGEQIVDEHDEFEDMQELALERSRERLSPPEADGDAERTSE